MTPIYVLTSCANTTITMTVQHVVLSDREIEEIQRAEGQTNLIRQAQESDEADQKLTIRQAVSRYKKAVF